MSGAASVASAPGKLVLGGEYAVLEGAPAIVAAVDVRARVSFVRAGSPASGLPVPPEVAATRRLVEAELGVVAGELVIDVRALRAGEHKLGVGSSAAAAVAAAALIADAHGLAVETARARIFAWALAGHAEVAPRGSGIDVAASTHGGVLRCVRADGAGGAGAELSVAELTWPQGLETSVVFTGTSARTSDLLDRVHALSVRDARAHRDVLDRLAEGAVRFARAFEAGALAPILEATRAYHRAMNELGRLAEAPIVDARLAWINEAAAARGGAAKPSGAGGGDVAIAFFTHESERIAFEIACRDHGFMILPAQLGAPGVDVDRGERRADDEPSR